MIMRIRVDLPLANGTTTPIVLERSKDREDGRRSWMSRSRIPIDGALFVRDVSTYIPTAIQADELVEPEAGEDVDPQPEADPQVPGSPSGAILEGIASSTSVDWHGTEMSRRALEGMAEQFRRGVPYVPAHHRDEWDDVMGQTFEAQIMEATVEDSNGVRPTLLQVRTTLYPDDPRSKQLMGRLDAGLVIGWSIGGWFTEMEVITNDEDEVEALVIHGVELDHLATTRRPSNPDSYISRLVADGSRAIRAATTQQTVESTIRPGNLRHVWKVVETEDTVHVVFGKADQNWEGIHVEERETEPQVEVREEVEPVESEGLVERMITDFADLPLAPLDTEWAWTTGASDLVLYEGREPDDPDWDRYKRAHIYCDPDKLGTKAGYKLPIAHMMDGKLTAIFRGVGAAMGAINGARGGVDIPDDERETAYKHLVKYYEKADREPPELRTVEEREVQDGPVRAANYMDLPMAADDTRWEWSTASVSEVLGEESDWQRLQLAHLIYDSNAPEDAGSYRYPFAMMVDGELKVVLDRVRILGTMFADPTVDLDIPEHARVAAYENLARYFRKAGEDAPEYNAKRSEPSHSQSSDGDRVDRDRSKCSTVAEGTDALRSATPAIHSQPTAEASAMSEPTESTTPDVQADQTSRLDRIESLLERTVQAMVELNTNPEPAPEPVVAEDTQSEADALRERLATMEASIARMASQPVRAGRPHAAPVAARNVTLTGYGALVRDCEDHLPEGSALVAVCRSQEDRRSADYTETPSRASLERDLRSILEAALMDGVITDPDRRATWS
jgi:hypothetical protein